MDTRPHKHNTTNADRLSRSRERHGGNSLWSMMNLSTSSIYRHGRPKCILDIPPRRRNTKTSSPSTTTKNRNTTRHNTTRHGTASNSQDSGIIVIFCRHDTTDSGQPSQTFLSRRVIHFGDREHKLYSYRCSTIHTISFSSIFLRRNVYLPSTRTTKTPRNDTK